jgi:hypothetical protein
MDSHLVPMMVALSVGQMVEMMVVLLVGQMIEMMAMRLVDGWGVRKDNEMDGKYVDVMAGSLVT